MASPEPGSVYRPPVRQLEGNVDTRDQEIERLTGEVTRLQHEVQAERLSSRREREAIMRLRQQLAPLYTALQQIFGVIEAVIPNDDFPAQVAQGGSVPGAADLSERERRVWKSWQDKFGTGSMASKFIDVLLDHGEMNAAQLRIAAKCGQQTVYDTVHRLNQAGLINKNGGKYSLKKL
jgi:hypothetical protein